jgi:hypothetical protein
MESIVSQRIWATGKWHRWKNKESVLTIGDNKPRYQQDGGQGKAEASSDGPGERKRFLGLF